MNRITEIQLEKLIADLIRDRDQIVTLNPELTQRDSLLWMLLGVLVNLLSVPVPEQAAIYDPTAPDPYYQAVIQVLKIRADPPFDPAVLLSRFD